MTSNDEMHAAVTGYHGNYRNDLETETEIAVRDATDRSRGQHYDWQPAVEFELFWGKTGSRAFTVRDPGEVRDLARVLAVTAGTTLADEAEETEETA